MATTSAQLGQLPTAAELRQTRFWAEGRPELPEMMQKILTEYSKIPAAETVDHVESVRERAWAVKPYPCIGRYRFINFVMQRHRLYHSYILPTLLKEPLPAADAKLASPLYLELGVCLGQETRTLLHAGVPSARIYTADVEPEFIPLGYDLFRDKDRFPPSHQLAPVDLFDAGNFEPAGRLGDFLGKVDILHLTSVFHLFNYDKQVEIAQRALRLMQPGGVILGCQTAHVTGTEYASGVRSGTMFRHSAETWAEMWRVHASEDGIVRDPLTSVVGAKLRVYSELIEVGDRESVNGVTFKTPQGTDNWRDDPGFRWMRYEVWVGDNAGMPEDLKAA